MTGGGSSLAEHDHSSPVHQSPIHFLPENIDDDDDDQSDECGKTAGMSGAGYDGPMALISDDVRGSACSRHRRTIMIRSVDVAVAATITLQSSAPAPSSSKHHF